MPLFPPFTIHRVAPQPESGKRCVVGTDTGITIATGGAPLATFHATYRENFRFHRVYRLQADTPSWPAHDAGRWATTPPATMLPAGTLFVQMQPTATARQKTVFPGSGRTTMLLGQVGSAALTTDFRPRGPQVWIPLSAHPDGDASWKRPRLEGGAPLNQWGITGDFDVMLDPYGSAPRARHFRMVTVWERFTRCESFPCQEGDKKGPARWTSGLFTLRPGVYAGYVNVMLKHRSDEQRKDFPSILVAWTWDAAMHAWVEHAASAKNPATRAPGCFIHPGSWPSYFLGCLSPGPIHEARPWGFSEVTHCRAATWSIFNDLGVDEANFGKHLHPSAKTAKWVLIRVDDPDDVCGIGAPADPGARPLWRSARTPPGARAAG